MKIFLCDIDGTIADCQHRIHFIQAPTVSEPMGGDYVRMVPDKEFKPDWRAFFAAVKDDSPIWPVIQTIKLLKAAGATIVMMSGRSDECNLATIDWLRRFDVPFDALYMRKSGDHRPDNIVKEHMLEKAGKDFDLTDIVAIFDDRQQVVDMYRSKGYKVFQVEKGDF